MRNSRSSFLKPGAATDLIVIVVLWCAALVICHPTGNFPLNDDWSYGRTVKYLLDHARYRPDGPTVAPLISQAVWGALFCLPFGFSFTALRLSTLVLSLVGLVSCYVLIRRLQDSRALAILCTLLLAFNPLYFALSNTFMTDVPFTTMATLSAMFFIHYFETESAATLVIATALSIAATLCRQLGLAMPFAFTAIFLLKHGFDRKRLLPALLPSILTVTALVGFNYWLKLTGRLPGDHDLKTDDLKRVLSKPLTIPLFVAHRSWNALMYLGCFLLPLLLVLRSSRGRKRAAKPVVIALVLFAGLTLMRFILMPALMPVHNNVLDPRGIGPLTLKDTQLLNLPHVAPLSTTFWGVVTILSLLGAWLLVARGSSILSDFFSPDAAAGGSIPQPETQPKRPVFWQRRLAHWRDSGEVPERLERTVATYFFLCTAAYLAPLMVGGFFDRYLLPTMVFLAAFLAVTMKPAQGAGRRWAWVVCAVLMAGFAWYAVAGTRDYFTWNRARWMALAHLRAANVQPGSIDGGFEFNGWELYEPHYKVSDGKSNWWVKDDKYLLSFGEMPGYVIYMEYDYSRWLPPSKGKILVLRRKAAVVGGR
jgi:hypothetical protein